MISASASTLPLLRVDIVLLHKSARFFVWRGYNDHSTKITGVSLKTGGLNEVSYHPR